MPSRDDDEALYSSSPAMFRSHPILFVIAVASIAIGIGAIILPLWWWSCRSVRLTVTRQKTILRKGILSLHLNEVRHADVRNVQLRQSFFQRILNVGTVAISSSGQAGVEIEVNGIPDPMRVKELIESGRQLKDEWNPKPARISDSDGHQQRIGVQQAQRASKAPRVTVAPQAASKDDDKPLLLVNDLESNSDATSFLKSASHSKLIRVTLALIGIVLSAFLMAKVLPWIMLLVSFGLVGVGLAFLFVPPVRMKVQEQFPVLVTHPKSKFITGGVVGYCVLLFCFSVSAIRANGRIQAHDRQVATLIRDAEFSLELGRIDEANDITRRLDTDRSVSDPSRVKALKSQVDAAIKTRDVKRANERVLQIVRAADQHLQAKQFGEVEKALNEAFGQKLASDMEPAQRLSNSLVAARVATATVAFDNNRFDETERTLRETFGTQGATELRAAQQLANKLLDVKVSSAKKLIEANDLNGARKLALEGERLPGVTEKHGLTELLTQIANLGVAARVAIASEHIQAERFDDAERELKAAISEKNATELTEARTLLAKVASERERLANASVVSLVADARRLPPDDAVAKLNEAIATPYATDLAEAKQQLQRAVEQKREQMKKLAVAAADREADAERKLKAEAAGDDRRKAEEELDSGGLVLLRKTVKANNDEITGEIVNRRKRKLGYAQISFNLYDASGAQVGTALANINGLEPGGKWKFKATTFGTDFTTYKFSELSGF